MVLMDTVFASIFTIVLCYMQIVRKVAKYKRMVIIIGSTKVDFSFVLKT